MTEEIARTHLDDIVVLVTQRSTRTAAIFGIAVAIITAAISLFLPKYYKSEAKLLPNAVGPNTSSLFQLASSAGFGELLSAGGLASSENPVLTYPEILLSATVLVRTLSSPYPQGTTSTVLDALHVRGGSLRQRMDNGVRRMREIVGVRANPRSSLIVVSAVTPDSVMSAYIVQQMLSELNRFNLESRSSKGRATREFIAARLEEARQEMAVAEGALVAFRQANLRIGNSPQLLLEQMRLERESTVRTELYQLLSRQYELARIEEKRDTPTFSVIDQARPPVRKHTPKVLLNALVAATTGFGLRLLLGYLQRPAALTSGQEPSVRT